MSALLGSEIGVLVPFSTPRSLVSGSCKEIELSVTAAQLSRQPQSARRGIGKADDGTIHESERPGMALGAIRAYYEEMVCG